MNLGTLTVYLEANLSKLSGRLGKAGKQIERYATRVNRAMLRAGRAIGRFTMRAGRSLARFAKYATIALIGLGGAAVKLAMDAEETENLFSVAFGDMADSVRRWSDELAKRLKINAVNVRRNVATFYLMFESMGLTRKEAAKLSKDITTLAMDMSSLYNIRLEDAFIKLRSAMAGETEPMRRLGVDVTELTIKTWALNNGLIQQGEEMTQAQKIMARYHVIMQATHKAHGDMEKTLDSTTNVFRTLYEQIKILGIEFGKRLQPAVTAVARAMREWLIENREKLVAGAEKIAAAVSSIAKVFREDVTTGMNLALDSFIVVLEAFVKAAAIAGTEAARAFINAFHERYVGMWRKMAPVGGYVIAPMLKAWAESDAVAVGEQLRTLAEDTHSKFKAIADKYGIVIDKTSQWGEEIKQGEQMLAGMVRKTDELADTTEKTGGRMSAVWEAMREGLDRYVTQVGSATEIISRNFHNLAYDIEASMSDALYDFSMRIKDLGDSLKSFIEGIHSAIMRMIADMAAQMLMTKLISPFLGGLVPGATGAAPQMTTTPIPVMAGGPVYAQHGFVNKGTDTVAAMLTPGEMVVPKDVTNWLRSALRVGEAAQPTVNIQVQAIDAQNTYQWLNNNRRSIAAMLQTTMSENHPFRRSR